MRRTRKKRDGQVDNTKKRNGPPADQWKEAIKRVRSGEWNHSATIATKRQSKREQRLINKNRRSNQIGSKQGHQVEDMEGGCDKTRSNQPMLKEEEHQQEK